VPNQNARNENVTETCQRELYELKTEPSHEWEKGTLTKNLLYAKESHVKASPW
jgi:hypothetical protein